MKRCRRLQFALLSCILAAISPLCAAQSINFQFTPDRLGQLYFPSMSPPLSMKWSANLGATVSYPIIVGNRVFVIAGSYTSANLYALDASTGAILWTQPSPAGYGGWVADAYDNGVLFVAPAYTTDNGGYGLFAFSPVDGHQLWGGLTVQSYIGVSAAPTIQNGLIFIVDNEGSIYAVRESDGTLLWTTGPYDAYGASTPAVTSDGVYLSGYCGPATKLDPATGAQIWSTQFNCEGFSLGPGMAVYRDLVYLLGDFVSGNEIFTLRATDGSHVGTYNSLFFPAFWQSTVFYTEYNAVVAVDIPSSRPLWIDFVPQEDNTSCSPTVVNGVVYTGTALGNVFGYTADTGAQVFSANVGQSVSCRLWYAYPLTGMGAGAGLLIAPVGNQIVAFQFDNFGAWQFVPVAPCRLVDTRQSQPIQGGTSQDFIIPQLGGCGIPTNATAYSLNVTAVPLGQLGYLTVWPTGEQQPVVSTMNSPDGRVKANAAIVPAGVQDDVSVYASNTTDVILDINGYFAPASTNTYQFYPLPPCRIVDTRGTNGPLGGPYLQAQQTRDFPVLTSSCIPSGVSPNAYSLNVTVVPHPAGQQLGYLTVWPAGEPQPNVSTLNNYTATVVANATIVPAGSGGDIDVYPSDNTDLLIDINGYFAAPGSGGLSLYPAAPCRVLDTRQNNGQPFQGELTVNVANSACAPPPNAQAYVFNATVVPPGPMPYLTLWPDGSQQPTVSTLNAYDGFTTSNMAIVPTSNGSIDAYAPAPTHLLLDISSYFAP